MAEAWFVTKASKKPKTVAGYRSILDVLVLPRWADVRLADISYEDVQTWVSGLSVDGGVRFEKGLSPSRVIQTYQVLNMVLKYAIRAKRLVVNPAADVELPPIGNPEKLYLSHQQVQELAVASGRFRTLVLVLSYCGLRFGEATALRRKNIDLKQARIWVRASATHVARQGIIESDTKTHEDRKVPIPASVVELLRTELPKDPEALAFPGRKGGYLPLGEFRWTFDQADTALQSAAAKRQEEIEETGEAVTPEFPVITPHELRHTCASLAIKAGANIKVLQNPSRPQDGDADLGPLRTPLPGRAGGYRGRSRRRRASCCGLSAAPTVLGGSAEPASSALTCTDTVPPLGLEPRLCGF
jgi:integrase